MEGDEKSAGGALAYWGLGARPCDACGVKAARLYCRADAAFLCAGCDVQAHGAGSRSRHARVWLCEVCEHALGQPMAYNSMQELGIFSCLGNKCIFWTEAGYVGGLPSHQKHAADKPATGGPYKSFAVDILSASLDGQVQLGRH